MTIRKAEEWARLADPRRALADPDGGDDAGIDASDHLDVVEYIRRAQIDALEEGARVTCCYCRGGAGGWQLVVGGRACFPFTHEHSTTGSQVCCKAANIHHLIADLKEAAS